jgi:5-hydroxyisourate hydrolase
MKQERISTHVLDLASGRPAAGLRVKVFAGTRLLGERETDADGRVGDLTDEPLEPGKYNLVFDVGRYFGSREHLFSSIALEVELGDPVRHHHIPLLISPFSATSYRGT